MTPPTIGGYGSGPTDEQNKERFKINPTSVPAYTPKGEQAGAARADEISLERAQLYVNERFSHTVQKPDPKTVAALEKLANDKARLDNGEVKDNREADAIKSAYRERMSYHQGQQDALRDIGREPKDSANLFTVNVDNKAEMAAWEQGQKVVFTAERERVEQAGMAFQKVASNEPLALPSDKLAKSGDVATVTSYNAAGKELTNSYRMDGDRVIHTAPNGYEKSMTLAESRVVQAEHAAAVNRNTAGALQGMKADPSRTYKQGEHTFSVRGDSLIRTDAQGNERAMPLAQFEQNLVARQHRLDATQKEARADLRYDNKERAKIKHTLEQKASRGDKAEVVTRDHKLNPTTWTLDAKGELHSEKGKGTDLSKVTEKFAAKIEGMEDAKAFNGQKTIVGRLREKEADHGKGATLKNPESGDTYRLSEDGKTLHCTRKDGTERPAVEAEKSHVMQDRLNNAKAAEEQKERTK